MKFNIMTKNLLHATKVFEEFVDIFLLSALSVLHEAVEMRPLIREIDRLRFTSVSFISNGLFSFSQ
jgi:hypothetical protein